MIIGLSLFTVFHLRHDIRYALSSGNVAPLEELQGVGMSYLDRYVRVHGVPERRNSLYIEPRGGRERESFFRLLDASPPIFVRARDTADRADLSASWTGRLRHFGDVAYASSLRDYFGKAAEVDHYLDLSQVHAGIVDPSASIADRIGRKVVLGEKPLVIEGTPSEYALEMPREKYPKQADAQHELERIVAKLGVAIRPLDASPDSFRFATPMLEKDPAKRAQLFAALGEAEIDILPEVPFYEAPRTSLHLVPELQQDAGRRPREPQRARHRTRQQVGAPAPLVRGALGLGARAAQRRRERARVDGRRSTRAFPVDAVRRRAPARAGRVQRLVPHAFASSRRLAPRLRSARARVLTSALIVHSIRIADTLTKKKVELHPLEPGHVRLYACGPTVYGPIHLGNARPLVTFDLVTRHLRAREFRVTYVRNITDVDDKIIQRAAELGEPISALTNRYAALYDEQALQLGCVEPDHKPRVTEFMPEIVALIARLIERGVAYESAGDVYFSVAKFPAYGELSHQPLDALQAGARVDVGEKKQAPIDFALWKAAKPGEPSWPSPWGDGRPGWHIECSAMAEKILGATFDLHGGGIDLVFPHHENERAQSQGANGPGTFSRIWMHNGFVNFKGGKISRSDTSSKVLFDRAFRLAALLERYSGEALRWFLLASHYASPITFEIDVDGEDQATAKLGFPGLDEIERKAAYAYETIARLRDQLAVGKVRRRGRDARARRPARLALAPAARARRRLQQRDRVRRAGRSARIHESHPRRQSGSAQGRAPALARAPRTRAGRGVRRARRAHRRARDLARRAPRSPLHRAQHRRCARRAEDRCARRGAQSQRLHRRRPSAHRAARARRRDHGRPARHQLARG